MGKKSQYKKNFKNKGGNKKFKTQWKCPVIPDDHQMFRNYYEKQLNLSENDFKQFWIKMKEKLPVVFRVNPNCPNFQSFRSKIMDQDFLKKIIPMEIIQEAMQLKQEKGDKMEQEIKQKQDLYEPKQLPKVELIPWYPGNVVFTMNTTKQTFKKSKIFAQFHKYLQKSFDSGLISRQQLVSMLPPIYLNIGPDDRVLDMCAAPGSKTSQLLQMMYGDRRWLSKGCVVANDADYSRAQMLIYQLHRSGTTGMIVINHPGQFMPELSTQKIGSIKQKFQFDKILCDVPCSGDGATRKIPIKWASWHTSDGMVLHPLQLSILMKGVNLLKKGGYLVYSTCSLNPIQNEAVINALFQKVTKGLELVDIHPMFGVKGRRGLKKWHVCSIAEQKKQKQQKSLKQQKQQKQQEDSKQAKQGNKKFLKQYSSYAEASYISKIKESMFPTAQGPDLSFTMRVLPHDQNSGGFYVALLKKTANFEWKYSTNKTNYGSNNQNKVVQNQDQGELLEKNMPVCDQVVVKQGDSQEQKQVQVDRSDEENEEDNEQQIIEAQQKVEQGQNNQKKSEKLEVKSIWKSKKQKKQGSKYQSFTNIGEDQFSIIQKFFGLSDEFRKLLYVRQNVDARKKVLLVSQGVRSFLEADTSKKIKIVNMGCQAFERGKQSFAGHQCLYRLCQDGIHFLLQHLQARKLKVPLSFFKKAISIKSLNHDEIEEVEIRHQISQMSQGSFCVYIDEQINGKRVIDALVGQSFKNSFHLMVSKEEIESLTIRYL